MRRAFTLVELIATMLVLGLAASFVAPLMVELSKGAAMQRDARRELWEANHALERVAELLRTAPDAAPDGSGLAAADAASFQRADGTGVRFEQGVLYLFDDDGESELARDVADFQLRLTAADAVSDAIATPEQALRAEFSVDLGSGPLRSAVSLARPDDRQSGPQFAFAFGQDDWTRAIPADPSREYVKVVQYGDNYLYDADRGYGYVDDDDVDTSPNNRGVYTGDDEIYDQFIGAKGGPPRRIVFRVDLPNGQYRIVLAGGDAQHWHASGIAVRDGSDPKNNIAVFDDIRHGPGEFFSVGFPGQSAPAPDGSGAQPTFLPEVASPVVSITTGFIEIEQIDAGSNGGSLCLLELWPVDGPTTVGVDFNDFTLESYVARDGGGHPTAAQVVDAGGTLRLTGNAWKAIELPYDITPNTLLEFEYASTSEPQMGGITTASTLFSYNQNRTVAVWGDAVSAGIEPDDIGRYPGDGFYRRYRARLQDLNPAYPLGNTRYLVLFNNDTSAPYSEAWFRNVRMYEDD